VAFPSFTYTRPLFCRWIRRNSRKEDRLGEGDHCPLCLEAPTVQSNLTILCILMRSDHRSRQSSGERCLRCHGLLWPADLLHWARRPQDPILAFRCLACGDMVDQVILENRLRQKRNMAKTNHHGQKRMDVRQVVLGL